MRTGDCKDVARADGHINAASLMDISESGYELGLAHHVVGVTTVTQASHLAGSPHVQLTRICEDW